MRCIPSEHAAQSSNLGTGRTVNDQRPLPYGVAAGGVGRCALHTAQLLYEHRVHLPTSLVDTKLRFADGTTSRIYRETVVDHGEVGQPCILVVSFRLRFVRGAFHTLFRAESLLNTPLFVGFPGFVSKLWLAHDANGVYRGVYQWDDAACAEYYARCLWRILALVSRRGSIRYVVVPGHERDELLTTPERFATGSVDEMPSWARVERVES